MYLGGIVRIFSFYTHAKDMTDKTKKPANLPKLPKLSRKQIKEGLDSIPMDTILLGVGKSKELTHKQKQFARNVALGKTKADAYREAYNSKGNPKTVGNNAVALAKDNRIQMEIEAYRLAKEAEEYRNPADLRRLVIHQLTQHALNEDINPAQRIKSLELLGKVAGVDVFMERKETTVIHQSGEIKARLLNKLKTIIDVESKDVSEGAESLLAELGYAQKADKFSAATDRVPGDPTTGASPQTGPSEPIPYTHSIPHKQSQPNSIQSDSRKDSPSQDVDFTEEKNEVVTLPLESDKEEGVHEHGEDMLGHGGVDDFWKEKGLDDGETPPVSDLKS